MRHPKQLEPFVPAAVAAGLALALVLPVTAVAQRGDPVYYEPESFAELDTNHDGKLEPAEVEGRSPLSGQWARFDTNGDGLIERNEFADFETYAGPTPEVVPPLPPAAATDSDTLPLGKEPHAPSFAELDIDENGVLSKGEAGGRKGLLDDWWQVDTNKDNVIERSEFSAFEVEGPTIPAQDTPSR